MKATVCLTYSDDSEAFFDFECDDTTANARGTLLMVCRGTLMASTACRITAYNEEGFDICSYIK